MRWKESVAAAAALLVAAVPAHANILRELSFERKMAESDIVIVGTVTAADGVSATVRVLTALKGTPGREVVVSTTSRIAEADPRCCDPGATYVMFLGRARDRPVYHSVNGVFGMVKIGTANGSPVEVIPGSRF